jgi:hypothetical protein
MSWSTEQGRRCQTLYRNGAVGPYGNVAGFRFRRLTVRGYLAKLVAVSITRAVTLGIDVCPLT